MMMTLAAIDLGYTPHVVLALYLVVLVGIGFWGYLRGRQTEEDYYLAGRGQGVLVTVLTIMATMFSSAAMLGIPGMVYKDGAAFLLFALNLPLAGMAVYLLGSRISRMGRNRGYVTPADMVADYYDGSHAVRLLAALTGFLYVIPYIVMQIKAGGYLAQGLFPTAAPVSILGVEMDMFSLGVNALSLITMIYVLVGGMRSVAWSDVLQGVLLLGGMILAGIATVAAMGGVSGYFKAVSTLPPEAQSLPGASGSWPAWKLMTVCIFGAVGSMVQPAQWMRYYSARSSATLRRCALIFALVLPACFLFGVMIVALGGRVLYPPTLVDGQVIPHEMIGSKPSEVDQVVITMIQEQIPLLLGTGLGVIVVSILLVAIMAASMSTADSNLHALSAVLTRDVYDRYVRPAASERERTWVGRGVIVVATILALWLVHASERSTGDFNPLSLIAEMMLLAIAYACQLLPATLDMLFFRRGTRAGVIAGMLSGLLVVTCFTPLPALFLGGGSGIEGAAKNVKSLLDIGCCGFLVNVTVFALVSRWTRPVDPEAKARFAKDLNSN